MAGRRTTPRARRARAPAARRKPVPLRFHPLTPGRWKDLDRLFGPNGACGGCWCMWWRLTRPEFLKGKGPGNRRAFRRIVSTGRVPGILAYDGREPVGWCAFAPREHYPTLARSRVLAPVDGKPVWSVTCFFTAKPHRGRGVAARLLEAAVEFAARRGAAIVEGYPVDSSRPLPDPFVYTGLPSIFRRAGFTEVMRRSPTRPILRRVLRPDEPPRGGRTTRADSARGRS